MTDVYRSSAFTCPRCPDVPLRDFIGRLNCDECHGVLISNADFQRACEHDAETTELALAFVDAPSEDVPLVCPRCMRTLVPCTIKVGRRRQFKAFHRCEQDGLWCDMAQLVAVLAVLHRGSGSGMRSGGAGSTVGLDGLPVPQNRPATAGLAISQWRRKPRVRVQPPAINPFADRVLRCPACAEAQLSFAGDRWTCAACSGTFVQNGALAALVIEMTGQPWELAAPTGAPGTRRCPVCAEPMLAEPLGPAAIDRCVEHGLWFDEAELGAVLEEAGEPPRGVGAWLRRLFG